MHILTDIVTRAIAVMGYPGVFFWMAVSACIPVPSEAILPFAGAQISTGEFSLPILTFVATTGNLIGSMIAYWVGAKGGRQFVQKYGRYALIRRSDVDLADRWFEKHGDATVFFGRCVPIIRAFISFPAGIAKMPFGRFCAYTFVGAIPWCYVLAFAGMKFGEHSATIRKVMHRADLAIGILFIVLVAVWLRRHIQSDPEIEMVPEPQLPSHR